MTFLAVFLAAFAPGIFWMWIIYRRDKCDPEPLALIIRAFLLGVVVAVPVAILETLMYPGSIEQATTNLATTAYAAFVVAGITEETAKFLMVLFFVYPTRHFNESVDGLVYSSAVALGFASLENLGYIQQFGVQVMLVRGPLSTLSHVIFSGFWGYPLALKKIGRAGWKTVAAGLVLAVLFHGGFDFILFFGGSGGIYWAVGLLAAGAVAFILMFIHARRISRFCRAQRLE